MNSYDILYAARKLNLLPTPMPVNGRIKLSAEAMVRIRHYLAVVDVSKNGYELDEVEWKLH